MPSPIIRSQSTTRDSLIATNSVLRNTYLLLSLTLIFSAGTAYMAMVTNARMLGMLPLLVGYFGLLFLTNMLRNSVWGIVSVFALTGFMGYTLGPVLNAVMAGTHNGAQIITTAFGMTGLIFFAMSGYILTTRKDMNFMTGFLFTGLLVAFVCGILGMIFHITAMVLMTSAVFTVLSSLVIMWQTSAIIHGGETNYISATVTLYVSLYNIFVNLLQLLSFFSNRD
jgi:modulator of FtsH protease